MLLRPCRRGAELVASRLLLLAAPTAVLAAVGRVWAVVVHGIAVRSVRASPAASGEFSLSLSAPAAMAAAAAAAASSSATRRGAVCLRRDLPPTTERFPSTD